MTENLVSLRVWGDFACFTRPEMKVERVSYPIMTPSAARGVLEAIFWEPEIYYVIDSIRVIKKGAWVAFLRNEVTKIISINNVSKWITDSSTYEPINAGGGAKDGTQRNMLALKDVEYVITAELVISQLGRRSNGKLLKYLNEFKQRAEKGKCFHRPCLGVREFTADFDWAEAPQAEVERRASELELAEGWRSVWPREDLGLMLYDVFDHSDREHGFKWLGTDQQTAPGRGVKEKAQTKARSPSHKDHQGVMIKPKAYFFKAIVEDCVMDCHPSRISFVGRLPAEE
jgi:CRISPR-associated protein Cas5d